MRTARIDVRVSSEELDILSEAAKIVGKPVSTFVREAAMFNSAVQIAINHKISVRGETERSNPSRSELQSVTEPKTATKNETKSGKGVKSESEIAFERRHKEKWNCASCGTLTSDPIQEDSKCIRCAVEA